jgi:hypothetical protein
MVGHSKRLAYVLSDARAASATAARGRELARSTYDTRVLADKVRRLYEELIDEKTGRRLPAETDTIFSHALRNHSR